MNQAKLSDWILAHRRAVVTLLILAFLVILILRFAIFPTYTPDGKSIDWNNSIQRALDGLISSIIVSFIVATALWWTKSPADQASARSEIPPREIGQKIYNACAEANTWSYIGHVGRYCRNKVFSRLIDTSRSTNTPINIRMIIIDPRNLKLCEDYCSYRQKSRSSETFREPWTVEYVQGQLFSTIAKSIWLNNSANQIRVEIALSHVISQFRIDISNVSAIVTQEDPQEPAYIYNNGTRIYDSYAREAQLRWDQSDPVDMKLFNSIKSLDLPSVTQIVEAFMTRDISSKSMSGNVMRIIEEDKSVYP